MNAPELLLRFIAGGGLIVIITLLAKTKYSFISGVMVLFPAVTLVGYYFLSQSVGTIQLKTITLFSIYALPATLIFLLVFYLLQGKYIVIYTLLFSVVAWFIAASVLIIINHYLKIVN